MTGTHSGGRPLSRSPRARARLPRQLPDEFQAAFELCYGDVTAVAFEIALASVDSADAENIAEDVGVALWTLWSEDPAKCAADRAWGAWTALAVQTKCINHANRILRERLVSWEDEDVEDVPDREWLNPEPRQELNELMDVIHTAIAGMSSAAREAFVLSQLEGATAASIAAQLGITPRNVRYFVAVGLKRVREAVHSYNGRALARQRGNTTAPESPEAT